MARFLPIVDSIVKHTKKPSDKTPKGLIKLAIMYFIYSETTYITINSIFFSRFPS